MRMPSLSLDPPSDALIFRFNEHRAGLVDEIVTRSVAARRAAAAARPEQAVDYLLNDLVMHERPRLRVVRPPDVEEDRDRVERISRALGRRAGEEELFALLQAQIRAYAEDIAGWFSVPAYHVARHVLRRALSLLLVPHGLRRPMRLFQELDSRIHVAGDASHLRDLAQTGVLILVPTHVSNLDSILVGFALDRYGLPPMCYGGGKNLFTNPVSSYFMTHLGAYKVDRRLRFQLYKEVLKTYSQVLLERGFHSIFFPGGTRSRSGAIEQKLKLGLAGTVLSAYVTTLRRFGPAAKRFYFIPVTINLPLTLEAETLIEDHLKEVGKSRYIIDDDEFSRLERIVAFARKLLTMEQAVEVWVGTPRDPLGNRVDRFGRSLDERGREVDPSTYVTARGEPVIDRIRDEEYTRELGAALLSDYAAGSSFYPAHLVSYVLFDQLDRDLPGLDLFRRLRHPREVSIPFRDLCARTERVRDAVVRTGQGRLSRQALGLDAEGICNEALRAFDGYHTRPAAERRGDDVVLVDRELLLYYRNRLAHHAAAAQVLR